MSTETLHSLARTDRLPSTASTRSATPSSSSSASTSSLPPPADASYPPSKAGTERELALIPPPDRGTAAYLFLAGAFAS